MMTSNIKAACIFLIHFQWKQTSFFAIFEWNSKCTAEGNPMNPSNAVSAATLIEETQSELIMENQPLSECA